MILSLALGKDQARPLNHESCHLFISNLCLPKGFATCAFCCMFLKISLPSFFKIIKLEIQRLCFWNNVIINS